MSESFHEFGFAHAPCIRGRKHREGALDPDHGHAANAARVHAVLVVRADGLIEELSSVVHGGAAFEPVALTPERVDDVHLDQWVIQEDGHGGR